MLMDFPEDGPARKPAIDSFSYRHFPGFCYATLCTVRGASDRDAAIAACYRTRDSIKHVCVSVRIRVDGFLSAHLGDTFGGERYARERKWPRGK